MSKSSLTDSIGIDHRAAQTSNPPRLNWLRLMPKECRFDVEISFEINTPYEGRSQRVGGCFGRDNDSGKIYLFHSAGKGGGRNGVLREPFWAWSGYCLIEVIDSDGESRKGLLVMPIEELG